MAIQIGEKPSPTFQQPLALLSDCHRRVESFLRALILVTSNAQGGTLDPQQRNTFETALRYFREAAPKHTADEEESLFPRMREVNSPEVAEVLQKIDRLEADHRRASVHHALVEQFGQRWLAQDHLPPDEVRQMAHSLNDLRDIYQQHIVIEDNEIFPLAGKVLPKDQLRKVGREMAARRGQDADRLAKLFPTSHAQTIRQ